MERDAANLSVLCQRLGASPQQAERMADQLLKRSKQLAAERGIKQVEALDHLLRVMMSGRQGEVYVNPSSKKGCSPTEDSKKSND